MKNKKINQILAGGLASVVVASTVLTVPTTEVSAASKTIKVSSQKELDKAIKTITPKKGKKVTANKISVSTKSKKSLVVKSGSYNKVTLEVKAGKVTLANKGKFKNVTISDVTSVAEKVSGNSYSITDNKMTMSVAKKISVSKINYSSQNGKLTLKGSGKDKALNIAKKTTVTSYIPAAVTTKADTTINLGKGAEGTTIKASGKTVKLSVTNKTTKKIKVTLGNKSVVYLKAGEKMVNNKVQVKDTKPEETNKDLEKLHKDYKLKWQDEFNGSKLNRSDWNVELHEPRWVNEELQEYVDSEENIQVKDGSLHIKPVQKKNADGTYSYTSGRINTQGKHDYTYGLFEVRAKVPTGKGYLPAFWMMPDENVYGQWPKCGEIDCMEVMGHETNKLYGTIHYGEPHAQSQGTYVLDKGNFADEFHTFSCEWAPGVIKWYVDGKLYHQESNWYSTTAGKGTVSYPAPFDQPFHMILNLAVGGSWVGYPDENTAFKGQEFEIDYVKAYQKDSYDENVTKPEVKVDLRDPDVNGNYIINGDFATAESLTDGKDWQFMTALEGEAKASIADNTMKIDTTKEGTVDYSVQLVQANVPLEKGATYKVSFDAKADEARKTNVAVKAPDRGYIAYMSEDPELTTDYKNYEYTFKMTADSDANGRLEYNMGCKGSTASIYIKNVKIEKVKAADPTEKEEKKVLSDGNYIYNSSFQEGTGRLGYWTIGEGVNASVTALSDGRRLKAEVTAANATVSQEDIAVTPGNYALSFDGECDKEGTVDVTVAGVTKTFKLSKSKEKFLETVEIPEGMTNKDVVIKFNTKGTYLIDNVRLVENTLIKNGSFNAGTSGFDIYLYNTADASYVVDSQKEDNALDLSISNTNDTDWKIQVKQNNVKLEKGQKYKLSFKIKSTINRSFGYQIQKDGSKHNDDWTPYVQDVVELKACGDAGEYTTIEKVFTMDYDTDAESVFNIALGGGNITQKHRVCIDDIQLEKIAD